MSVDLVRVGAVTDTVLQSLRTQILDESEPLAGLLRKCLMLGAETHSETLRDWARRELNGYRDEEEVPDYRQLFGPSIMMDSMSGNTWATNQMIDRLNLPQETHEYVKDSMPCDSRSKNSSASRPRNRSRSGPALCPTRRRYGTPGSALTSR